MDPSSPLPQGTVTFLFSDIEGSTRLLQHLGPRYAELLGDQRRLLRAAFHEWHGHEIDTQGDSCFAVFSPMRLDGRLLIDGGVVSPIPCRTVWAMGADVVSGVALEGPTASETPEKATRSASRGGRMPKLPEVMLRAYDYFQRGFAQQCLQEAELAIRVVTPPAPLVNFDGGPRYVEAGERAVEAAVERLWIRLPWVRS